MASQEVLSSSDLQRERNHRMRLYGTCAISANVLLAIKGLIAHDPFLVSAGLGTAIAQGVNSVKGDKHTNITLPAIIICAGIFAGGGVWAHNMHRVRFGLIKGSGVYMIKSHEKIAKWIERAPPLARLIRKLPPITKIGEAALGLAAGSLLLDGGEQVWAALRHGAGTKDLAMGLATIAATLALVVGQHHFAKAPDKQPAEAIGPRRVTLSAAPEL